MKKTALILGIGGQDGSYLADILLEKDYTVHGMYRRSSGNNLWRIGHILDKVTLHQGDMADYGSVQRIVNEVAPHEIYNEADQDSVGWSHQVPGYQTDITGAAVGRLLEIVREFQRDTIYNVKVFQPCTAMMFGDAAILPADMESPQTELTRFNPQSPYACAKCLAYYLCRHYRYQHDLFVSTGILYNHDSPRRTDEYLLHKICKFAYYVGEEPFGYEKVIYLGNLDGRVDIGYARDYMVAAHQMLQLDKPDDFVLATGEAWTVGELLDEALRQVGRTRNDIEVRVDQRFYCAPPKSVLVGNANKARLTFGFNPTDRIPNLIERLLSHFSDLEVYK